MCGRFGGGGTAPGCVFFAVGVAGVGGGRWVAWGQRAKGGVAAAVVSRVRSAVGLATVLLDRAGILVGEWKAVGFGTRT